MQTAEFTPDDWYEELMNAHRGLSDEQSRQLDAMLVLLLADQISDAATLRNCLQAAREAALLREEPSCRRRP